VNDSAGIEPAWVLGVCLLPDFFQSIIELDKKMVSVFILHRKTGEVMTFDYACYFHGFSV
jgi:hypothetical protein